MKQIINTPEAPETRGYYSQATVGGGLVFLSGQVAPVPGRPEKPDSSSLQTETSHIMRNLAAVLGATGCSFANVIGARIYTETGRNSIDAAYRSHFGPVRGDQPEWIKAKPPLDDAHVEIAMTAALPGLPGSGKGNLIHIPRQTAFTADQEIVRGISVRDETLRMMENVAALLGAGECGFDDVMRSRIVIADASIFADVDAAYGEHFVPERAPARECVVAPQLLSDGARVGIAITALQGAGLGLGSQ